MVERWFWESLVESSTLSIPKALSSCTMPCTMQGTAGLIGWGNSVVECRSAKPFCMGSNPISNLKACTGS